MSRIGNKINMLKKYNSTKTFFHLTNMCISHICILYIPKTHFHAHTKIFPYYIFHKRYIFISKQRRCDHNGFFLSAYSWSSISSRITESLLFFIIHTYIHTYEKNLKYVLKILKFVIYDKLVWWGFVFQKKVCLSVSLNNYNYLNRSV